MDSLQTKAVLAGLFFGLWPLFMNRSGLTGNVSSAAFSLMTFIIVLPFAIKSGGSLAQTNWIMVITAGIIAGVGLLCFNGMLAGATPQKVGTLFLVMIVVQTCVPAVYHIIMNGELSPTKAAGLAAAFVAAVLLMK